MAYTLFSQSYGVNNALANVTIFESATGVPALILSSATGGVVSDKGLATLDGSGNLSVYIDTARTWVVKVIDEAHNQDTSVVGFRQFNSLAELVSTTGVQGVVYSVFTAGPPPVYVSYIWNGVGFALVAPAPQTLVSGTAPAVNLSLGTICTLSMGANATVTLGAPTNLPSAGTGVTFVISQDAVGGRTLALNAAYVMTTALSNTGNTANKKTLITFTSDGTSLVSHGANVWY